MMCAEFADQAAELALGTLEGQHRASALGHAETCPSCRALLQDLSLTSDALLQLAPSAEPPIGFEARLFDAMGARPTAPPKRRRSPLFLSGLVAAAVVALAVGIGVGRLAGHDVANTRGVAIANLVSGQAQHGQVVVAPGHPPWLFVSVNDLGPISTVGCQITLTDGRVVKIGTFALTHGYGGWTVPLNVSPAQLQSAELLAPDGSTIVSARFES